MQILIPGNPSGKPIPCFRGGAAPPPLETLEEQLKRPSRIQCRKDSRLQEAATGSKHLDTLLRNEKKIERALRSKSGWDAIFELAPMSPWRETSTLHKTTEESGTVLYLDFKNFYPALICSLQFAHPAKLMLVKNPDLSWASPHNPPCGLFRTILHPNARTPDSLRQHHPFHITHSHKTLPIHIGNRPLETFLHGPEIPIWQEWFDLEITEALISTPTKHPLQYATTLALEKLMADASSISEEEREHHKLLINLASTTPKLTTPKTQPSPFGVHCLPTMITAMARALLCQTSQLILSQNPSDRILAANTDGLLVLSQNPEKTLHSLKPILGSLPGQIREKARGDEAIIAGPNLWWILEDGKLQESNGRGKTPENPGLPLDQQNPVPLHYRYGNKLQRKIASVHLSDFRHQLNHVTLTRSKFEAPEEPKEITNIISQEKKKSLGVTLRSIRQLRKRLTPGTSKSLA